MSKCRVCGKRRNIARKWKKLRGKYNPRPKRAQLPNLQKVKIPLDVKRKEFKKFLGKKIWLCTQCLKTLYKE